MGKLKLQPDPTFTAKVQIPVAGAEPATVEFTFKHRDRDELQKFITESGERDDVDSIMAMASGWELSDTFDKKNVALLVKNFIAAPRMIFDAYIDELVKAKAKN